jgi:group I intron endonuclease
MRKHGINNFVFEIIEECDDRLINEREKFWITELDSRNPNKGYNLHVGGRGQTTSSRRKLSEALKGNKHCVGRRCSAESRYKMGSGNRGKHWNLSDETKRKLSVTSSGTRNYMYGKKGVDCPNSKLTREQLDDIRTRIKIGESFRSIAKNLNVSHQTISRIAK